MDRNKFTITTSKQVKKFLGTHRELVHSFFEKTDCLSLYGLKGTGLDVKPLKNKKNHYRLRITKWRFLFEVKNNEILIYFYKAGSRGGIYK